MAPGFRGNMWESDPPPINGKHILAKNDDPFPSNLYIPPPLPALNRLVIEFPPRADTSKLFVHWVRYSNHLKGSSQRPSRPLMFIMSASLSSAPQRCTVCFYKGVRIWMAAWVLVWCRGGGDQNQIRFSLKMKGERAFTVSDVYLCEVWGCVFTWKRNLPLTSRDLWLPGGSSMQRDCSCMSGDFLRHRHEDMKLVSHWLASLHPDRRKKGNAKDNLRSYMHLSLLLACSLHAYKSKSGDVMSVHCSPASPGCSDLKPQLWIFSILPADQMSTCKVKGVV